ncbi:MAG: ATP-binding protein [Acidobacteriota bacterium]
MSKSKKFKWISPPNPEIAKSWKAFISIGEEISKKMTTFSGPELIKQEEREKIFKELLLQNGSLDIQSEEPESSEDFDKEPESKKVDNFLKKKKEKGQKWISLLKEENLFPFLGKDVPLSAKGAIAFLCFNFIDKMSIQCIGDIYGLFRTLEIPLEDYRKEGEKLVEYSSNNSFLSFKCFDGKPAILLTKKGYREILNIEVESEIEFENRPKFPFEKRMEREFKKRLSEKKQKMGIIPDKTLSDLVLDKEAKLKIDYIVTLKKIEPSFAFTILLWGPPGTGKTLTANAIAGELKKRLITLDLSNVLDKFIGETEKIISSIFSNAEENDSIILIDEADSFLKRRGSEIHAWWNNLVNHLLKLIEQRKVSIILCTNLYEELDFALMRRIDEIIEYKIPKKEERFEIWQKEMSRNNLDSKDFDINALAEIELSGGLIANAARKLHKIKVVMGTKETIDSDFVKTLALDEKKKMDNTINKDVRIVGFGG